MIKVFTILILVASSTKFVSAQDVLPPDTITLETASFKLKGLLWRPAGNGSLPAILFCHGTYDSLEQYDVVQQTSVLGPLFAKNGYIFFGLFQRGVGLSIDQGENSANLMLRALKEKGQEERNKIQIKQLQTVELKDMISALALLRKRKDVDTNRIAIIGHSYGGSMALLTTASDLRLKATVIFAAAAGSWNNAPQLCQVLSNAVEQIKTPVMIVHAQNDYSVTPGYALDSMMNLLNKPHLLKIYPSFGNSLKEGHNIIFLSTDTWEKDVLSFLRKYL